jgi:thiol-disulfide isomerase/thioredoxin
MQTVETKMNRKGLAIGLSLTLLVLIAGAFYLPAALNRAAQSTGSSNLTIGRAFPDFRLADIEGNAVTPASLAGKPYILWFTAGWCVPCQIGAERVARLDNSYGGDRFNVVVVFIDKTEPVGALRRWQQKHASGDWFIAFDNKAQPLEKLVSLQYLDSKYLVDADGILRDVDFRIVKDDYLKLIANVTGGA